MSIKNYTLVIDLTHLNSEVAGALIGAAKERGIRMEWPNNALLCAINPAVGEHRDFANEVREAGLHTHVR